MLAVVHHLHAAGVHHGHASVVHHLHVAMIHTGHAAVVHTGHRTMVHARHATVAHATHTAHVTHHVSHGQPFHLVERRHCSLQAPADSQRATCITSTVHRLREDGVGVVLGRDQHIASLAGAEAEFVHRDRLDVLPIDLNHLEFQPRDAHVVERVAGAVNEAQPHSLARRKQARPIAGRRDAVGQIGERCPGEIGQIGRVHAHLVPHGPLFHGRLPAIVGNVAEEVHHRRLVVVVVVALRLELGEDAHRIFVGPVRQQHAVIAVGPDRVTAGGIDDEGAIDPGHLLEARMRVVPVAAALSHLEAVGKGLAGRNAVEADARYAIHLERQDNAVPVD
ncbi:hypothetical protein R77592_04311 [Ralstonia mannitolilytica]|nr:hypothetical protein R77592_04311 [Ralstonia mannitolilytica]